MQRYAKGARGERELINLFYSLGFSVIRSAGSGVNSISPDIIAIKNGKGISLECKAWDSTSVAIEPEKWLALSEWQRNTLMDTYIAWRMSGEGWYLVRLDEMSRNEKSYSVTMKKAKAIGRRLEHIGAAAEKVAEETRSQV